MQPEAICCNECGKAVSNAIAPPGKPLVVRAWVECPECIEKQADMEDPEVVTAAFVAQCRADGRAERVQELASRLRRDGLTLTASAQKARWLLKALNLSALLNPEAESEEGEP